jgi:hypothetical protein
VVKEAEGRSEEGEVTAERKHENSRRFRKGLLGIRQ